MNLEKKRADGGKSESYSQQLTDCLKPTPLAPKLYF